MRTLLILCALFPVVAAADTVRDFASDDAATRDVARREILRVGTPLLKRLDEAHKASRDKDTKSRIAALIDEIKKREPHGLRFHCGLPKMKLTPAIVRGREFQFSVSVKNLSDEERVLYPYLTLRVLDAQGNPVPYSRRLGRGGRRPPGNPLERIRFVTLKPGQSWAFQDCLVRYMHDARWINGWKIEKAGSYTLEFTYAFDLAKAKEGCDPQWNRLDGAKEPWNRAITDSHTFSTRMTVE